MEFTEDKKSQAQTTDRLSASDYSDAKPNAMDDSANAERLAPVHTHIEKDEIVEITDAHREYLIQRHGTSELERFAGEIEEVLF